MPWQPVNPNDPIGGGKIWVGPGTPPPEDPSRRDVKTPDLTDPSSIAAKLHAQMRLHLMDGLRSTFTSSLRGQGGPGMAGSLSQLDWWMPPPSAPAAAGPYTGTPREPLPPPGDPVDEPIDPTTGLPIDTGPKQKPRRPWWRTPSDPLQLNGGLP